MDHYQNRLMVTRYEESDLGAVDEVKFDLERQLVHPMAIGKSHSSLGYAANSYCASSTSENYQHSKETHEFEWPKRAIRPNWNCIHVGGCGLLLGPKNKLSIFFTANGILLGQFFAHKLNAPKYCAKSIDLICLELLTEIIGGARERKVRTNEWSWIENK
jgi:hypothetical protein